jgi:RHS repeat-associated protein
VGGSSRGGAGVGLLLARAYGYEWVPETGLYHVGAREYDPRTARWLQRDPIDAASGDPNLYRYCGNDPVNYRDPTGTEIQDELSSVTCTRGKMEIVRMALEEARASGTSIRETQWWGYKLKTFIEHHIFPQADRLRRLFEKIGIDVDDCVMKVPDCFSDWIHSGKGKGGWWNRKWDEFMELADRWLKQKGESWDEMSECSKKFLQEQAHVWALKMLELVGVTDFDWSECMRYTRAKKKRR